MHVPRRILEMCVVNPELVGNLAQLVGSQAEVMGRLGISWNTWVKIRTGRPILMSVGRRLRSRILNNADAVSRFRREFPSSCEAGVDRGALEAAFFLPADSGHRGATARPAPMAMAERAGA